MNEKKKRKHQSLFFFVATIGTGKNTGSIPVLSFFFTVTLQRRKTQIVETRELNAPIKTNKKKIKNEKTTTSFEVYVGVGASTATPSFADDFL